MSSATYRKHFDRMTTEKEKMEEEVFTKATKAMRKARETINLELRGEAVLDIVVSFDGTWHKRGHTSIHGVGVVINVLTGLAIDAMVLSKYCHTCVIAASELGSDSPEFSIRKEGHVATGEWNKNYEGSSGAMEMTIAEKLWRRSIEKNQMRYTTVLSDGDAKTLAHLNDVKPYSNSVVIGKEECANHVAKRMGTGLRKLVSTKKTEGVKLGGKGKGQLTEKTIKILTSYYRTAIVKNIPDVKKMQKAVMSTLYHCSSTDEQPNHSSCPQGKESWCFYNQCIAEGRKPDSHDKMSVTINKTAVDNLLPLYHRLSSDDLLTRCARGGTQNANESLHSMIWRRCPKVTFVSRKRVDLAVIGAIAEFNMGALKAEQLKLHARGDKISREAKLITGQRDQRRKRKRLNQKEEKTKKIKRAKTVTKKVEEQKQRQVEGTSYAAGEF